METACGVPGDSPEHALHVQRLTQQTLSIAFPNPVCPFKSNSILEQLNIL